MNLIFPIILILTSLGIFFGYVDPNYKGTSSVVDGDMTTYGVKQLQEEYKKYNDTVANSTKVVRDRDVLLAKNNSITEANKARLVKMLPDNIDNVKLILEISDIAEKRNISLRSISVGTVAKTSDGIGADSTPYGTLNLKVSVNTSYENFLLFLKDLENNLRLIDIVDITFSSTDIGFYDFNISLNTYWLK